MDFIKMHYFFSSEDLFSCYNPNLSETLGDFLCIPTPNTGQLNPVFHTFAEFRPIVNRIVAWQSTDWLAANAQFSPNDFELYDLNYMLFPPFLIENNHFSFLEVGGGG